MLALLFSNASVFFLLRHILCENDMSFAHFFTNGAT